MSENGADRYRVVRVIVMEGDRKWLEQTLSRRVTSLGSELGRYGRRIYEQSCSEMELIP